MADPDNFETLLSLMDEKEDANHSINDTNFSMVDALNELAKYKNKCKTLENHLNNFNHQQGNTKPTTPKNLLQGEKTNAAPTKKYQNKSDADREKYSGLRIVKPVISSVSLDTKMKDKKFVKLCELKWQKDKLNDDNNWVIMAVIIQKLPPKQASNGKTYGILKLSDFNTTISLFLFGDSYKEHWKIVEGTVIAVVNATVMKSKEGKKYDDISLSLDCIHKLLPVGMSKDMGKCIATRNDGAVCTNVIDRYGAPHVPKYAPLKRKMEKDIYFYQGQTFMMKPPPPTKQNKKISLKDIGGSEVKTVSFPLTQTLAGSTSVNNSRVESVRENSSGSKVNRSPLIDQESFRKMLQVPSVGSRNIIQHLTDDQLHKDSKNVSEKALSASQLLKVHAEATKTGTTPVNFEKVGPRLGRGLLPGAFINLPSKISRCAAKQRAIAIVKQKPLKNVDPNSTSVTLTEKDLQRINKRREDNVERSNRQLEKNSNSNQDNKDSPPVKKKRKGILGDLNTIDLQSPEGQLLLEAKSAFENIVTDMDLERQELYFQELERKEKIYDQLQSIRDQTVSAYHCKACRYTAQSISPLCKEHNHTVNRIKARKRFFECRNCNYRTITYNQIIPIVPCRKCQGINFKKTGMYKEKEGPKADRDILLPRGVEHPNFLNSLR
ncbi:uncharacterized protein TRIADDRAFT_55391 [Trichoplax adhaerens]|uniref:Replication factor Mcm10 C-terminal domain-containing protein n=1 Tax=Trichoplax adhaerens TaxID=10228 RepID=B3RUS2_TRIAD|nr:hypothetical protein TRIADDRAFT_55391 [Trichoplax adhaerens]EDV25373.1 hypothetical protein TRIADDRAFT_55391 [Trichoplax adhaerens]|eukprot:XP_002111406.1 hypothetical protein TRIADDRAFT_55391 [Trichoplax adhaerens]